MKVKTQLFRKVADYEDLVKYTKPNNAEWVEVQKEILLSGSEFNYFLNNFLEDYDFLKDDDNHLFYVTDGDDAIFVDTQGYNYARYTGIIIDMEG
jgi:hypothetical protein